MPGQTTIKTDAGDTSVFAGAPSVAPMTPRPRASGPWAQTRAGTWILGAVGIVGAAALLTILQLTNVVDKAQIPEVWHIVGAFFAHVIGVGSVWVAVGNTLYQAAIGLAISTVVGVPLGLLLGGHQLVWRAVQPIVEFLRPVPPPAILPLIVLVYGTGQIAAIIVVIFGVFLPIMVQAMYGRKELDGIARDTGRAFHFGPFKMFFRVTLPSAMPFIATGIRLSAVGAIVLAIICEQVFGTPGIGTTIVKAENSVQFSLMYALILLTGILSVIVIEGLERFEASRLKWHPAYRRKS